MTREESKRPFAMLHANWPFIDFSDEVTAEIWFAALEPYLEGEVRKGVSDAIANIQGHAPNVAEIREFVQAVHDGTLRATEEETRNMDQNTPVSCWDCNDYGFVTIIYPNGDEAVRACNCQKASQVFGAKVLERMREPMPKWKQEALFGENEIPSQYKLVRVSRALVETGETYKDNDGTEQQRQRFGYVPYQPRGGREEIFWQYQKVARNT